MLVTRYAPAYFWNRFFFSAKKTPLVTVVPEDAVNSRRVKRRLSALGFALLLAARRRLFSSEALKPFSLSPPRLFPHLTHSIREDLSVRILAFNVSLLCMRSSNSCLPPTERSQHITAGRSAPVSTIRACVAAPAQAPLLPGPSPLTYCAHPKATHPSLRGYYHPLRYISLCLSHTHLFSQVLIIIYLLNKTLPMPPGQVNLLRINVSLSLEE